MLIIVTDFPAVFRLNELDDDFLGELLALVAPAFFGSFSELATGGVELALGGSTTG